MKISKNNTIVRSLLISGKQFAQERAFRHGAALSYYTLFSIVPILVILIAVFGMVIGTERVEEIFFELLSERIGSDTAKLWQAGVSNVSHVDSGFVVFKVVAIVVLVFSSTAMFFSMKNSIHDLWHAPIATGKFLHTLFDRLLSFIMLITLGFVILIIFFAESVLLTSTETFGDYIGLSNTVAVVVVQSMVGVVTNWIVLYIIYYFLPDIKLNKQIVLIGSLVVAVIFQIGNGIIGWYLNEINMASTYGIVGSIMLVLAWVFYASQTIFFGAKFMYVYSEECGYEIVHRKSGSFTRKKKS